MAKKKFYGKTYLGQIKLEDNSYIKGKEKLSLRPNPMFLIKETNTAPIWKRYIQTYKVPQCR